MYASPVPGYHVSIADFLSGPMSNNLADIRSNDNFCQLVLEASALGGNLYQPQPRTPNATLDRLFLSLKYKNKGSAFVAAETHPIIMVDEASGRLTNEL